MKRQWSMRGLRAAASRKPASLQGIWEAGELFIMHYGKVVYNRAMCWADAEELCDDLGISLEEV